MVELFYQVIWTLEGQSPSCRAFLQDRSPPAPRGGLHAFRTPSFHTHRGYSGCKALHFASSADMNHRH